RDSEKDHPAVMEVLTAFIREHSREQLPPSGAGSQDHEPSTRPDVQAAVTVVGRRDAQRDILPIDLTRADLTGAHLTSAHLASAHLADVWWPEGVQVPGGWMVDGDSGRLKRAGRLSEVADPGLAPGGAITRSRRAAGWTLT